MLKRKLYKLFKKDFDAAFREMKRDHEIEERKWKDYGRNEWAEEMRRKENAEQTAYNRLMSELQSEEFIDKLVARLKAKQL